MIRVQLSGLGRAAISHCCAINLRIMLSLGVYLAQTMTSQELTVLVIGAGTTASEGFVRKLNAITQGYLVDKTEMSRDSTAIWVIHD